MRSKVAVDADLIETQADLLGTVADVAKLMLRERDLKNRMDKELKAVRDRYDERLEQIAGEIELRTELCADYCGAHPDLFPKDRKSVDLVHAVIGFRSGTPKVKLLKGWKWAAVLAALKEHLASYVRAIEEPDKEKMIANRAHEGIAKMLARCGVEVANDESFFIEPKLEDQPAGVKVEA